MIRLALPNSPYIVPETGLPVEGRMKVFLHDSDEYANLYTIEGGEYVQAENPQLLHAGLTDSTIFTALGVFDVVIEKYIGAEGMLSVDSPDTDFEPVGDYEVGMDFDIASYSRNTVNTVEELREVNPELGMVTVKWYAEEGDCPPRTYVWDGESENQEDGGYVIGSDVSDTGKWILMWDDEVLPCSVYGVKPGTEANVSLLLSYPAVVGSFQMATAPRVRFSRGTYTSNTAWSTSKEILFDPGAKFTQAAFTCPNIQVIGARSDYVADFTFTAADAVAHSSWFRTAEAFWHCDAQVYVLDNTNYFSDLKLYSVASLTRKEIKGEQPLALTYEDGVYLSFTSCRIYGEILRQTDFVKFTTRMGDANITGTGTFDPGLVASGHHTEYSIIPYIEDFTSANRWMKAFIERKGRFGALMTDTLDFKGRTVTNNVNTSLFSKVKDVVAENGFTVAGSVEFVNVKGQMSIDTSFGTVIVKDSEVTVEDGAVGPNYFMATDSTVTLVGNGFDPSNTQIMVKGGQWNGKVWLSNASAEQYTMHGTAAFECVRFTQTQEWRVNNLYMQGCYGPVKADLLPYSSDSVYKYSVELVANTFTGASRFWFTMYGDSSHPHTEVAGKAGFAKCIISGNQFRGTDAHPLKMLRWHPYSFGQFLADDVGAWEYDGNTGNCPKVRPDMVKNASGVWNTTSVTGPDSYPFYIRTETDYIFCPYFHYVGGAVDYMKDSNGKVRFGGWIGGFPAMGSSYNFWVYGGLKKGQTEPADYWDEDLNNTFIVYTGFTKSSSMLSSDLAQGVLMWPEY